MQRRLYRSQRDRMLGGVCAGLGEYLDMDPTVIRLIFILLALLGGHGILVYLILWIVIPPAPLSVLRPSRAVSGSTGNWKEGDHQAAPLAQL